MAQAASLRCAVWSSCDSFSSAGRAGGLQRQAKVLPCRTGKHCAKSPGRASIAISTSSSYPAFWDHLGAPFPAFRRRRRKTRRVHSFEPLQRRKKLEAPSPGLCAAAEQSLVAELKDIGVKSDGQVEDDNCRLAVSSPPEKPLRLLTVAVDVDEVLGSFLATLNLYIHEELDRKHELEEFFVYDFMKIWGCSQEEANHRVHSFFDSHHFEKGIPPIPGAYSSLQRLSTFCDLVVVTSRQHVIREPTLDWIATHYPGIFQEVYFGNHFALAGPAPKPKSEICREVGAQVLIDDNPRYALECAQAGLHVLLFDWNLGYPWSKTADGPKHPLIRRVKDWEEVEEALQDLAHIRP